MRKLLLTALFVRILFGIGYYLTDPWEVVPLSGEHLPYAGTDGYLQLSRNLIVEGRWAYYPGGPAVHNRPPLTSLLMLPAAAFPQHWYWPWLLLQVVFQLITLWAVVRIGRLLLAKDLWLGWILAFHPLFLLGVRASTFVGIAAMLLCLLLWATLAYQKYRRRHYLLYQGVLLGLLLLTHGTFIVLLPIYIVYHLRSSRGLSWVIGLALLVVLPWTLRNYQTFDTLIPVATGAGVQYWKGKSAIYDIPDLEHRVYRSYTQEPLEMEFFGPVNPKDDGILLQLAIHNILDNPVHFLSRSIYSFYHFWTPNDAGALKFYLTLLLNLPLLLLGLYQYRRQPRMLMAMLILIPLPFALLGAITSYYLALLPLLVVWGLSPRLRHR